MYSLVILNNYFPKKVNDKYLEIRRAEKRSITTWDDIYAVYEELRDLKRELNNDGMILFKKSR